MFIYHDNIYKAVPSYSRQEDYCHDCDPDDGRLIHVNSCDQTLAHIDRKYGETFAKLSPDTPAPAVLV